MLPLILGGIFLYIVLSYVISYLVFKYTDISLDNDGKILVFMSAPISFPIFIAGWLMESIFENVYNFLDEHFDK